ncbi:hypothetical protein EHS25_004012 [Saitozyma podzolica]|uniref:Uncharacterized protein n=1 Tax=Saitozyma podzolica TaxID=1890683 RepID=A0A427YT06_9TREE|nr:hypothetical protein EHS25_004012 [Saitozyma podzolica]
MRNSAVTAGIIDDWIDCPDSVPGCDAWNFKHPGDQAVFSHFIMKGLQKRNVVAVLPCMEATGNTLLSEMGSGCNGTIVTHNWWYGKQALAQEAISMTALHMMRLLESL